MTVLIVTLLSALLNYLRGSTPYVNKVSMMIGYTAIYGYLTNITNNPDNCYPILIFLIGSIIYWVPGWGAWYSLGNTPANADSNHWGVDDPRWNSTYVKTIQFLSFENPYIGLFIRHLFIFPLIAGLTYYDNLPISTLYLAIPYASAVLTCYAAGWSMHETYETRPIPYAETLAGAVHGILIYNLANFANLANLAT